MGGGTQELLSVGGSVHITGGSKVSLWLWAQVVQADGVADCSGGSCGEE